MFHPVFDIGLAERDELRELPVDHRISRAAAARDGVLTRPQLIAVGVSPAAIGRRVDRRLLHPRYRGVYAVGRLDLTRRGRLRAALLRCGRAAALSHHTAAAEDDLLTARDRIAITVTGTPRRPPRSSGIDLRYTDAWAPGEVVWVGGLPCTSLARTLADLAGRPGRDFDRVWNAADQRRLLDVGPLVEQLRRRRMGSDVLRARLEHAEEAPPTESEAEELFFSLCAGELPRPVCQSPIAIGERRQGRIDFVFPGGVSVEVDSRRWHAIQAAFEADRAKDLALREAGFDPHRHVAPDP